MKEKKIDESAKALEKQEKEEDAKKQGKGAKTLSELGNNKFLLMFVCIFLCITLIFGIVLGSVAMVKRARSVLEYGSVRMERGVANYFMSYSKAYFISTLKGKGVDVKDTEEFWNSKYVGTKTYGDQLREEVEKTLREVATGVYLFDLYSTLTKNERQTIEKNAQERLLYIAEGDKGEFNRLTKDYGFDYSDFLEATEMMYKAKMAQYAIYGKNGSDLVGDKELSDNYYEAFYSRVKLLFIRMESDFALDDDGKRKMGDDGYYEMVTLSEAERQARLADVEEIRQSISNYETGENGQISPIAFNVWLEKYNATNMFLDPDGEYYSSYSSFTQSTYEELPDVVTKALQLEVGQYGEVELDLDGEKCYCFIYVDELVPGAYTDTSEDGCFSDFYSLMATYLYTHDLEELQGEVEMLDAFYNVDLYAIKPNGIYTIGI